MGDGKDISAPAVDLLNENPSLVAFGKIHLAMFGEEGGCGAVVI